jgi:hypothetical protein
MRITKPTATTELPFLSSGEGHPLLADGTHPQGMVFATGYLKLGPDVGSTEFQDLKMHALCGTAHSTCAPTRVGS